MKKIFFLLTGLCFGASAMAQDISTDIYTAATPGHSTKLTGEALQAYVRSNFKKTMLPSNQEQTYLADGVLICFWALHAGPVHTKPLEELKTRMVAVLERNNTVNYARIDIVNNIRFLVYEYQKDGEVFLSITAEANKKDEAIHGLLQFKEADMEKAHQALKDLLASMHYKE